MSKNNQPPEWRDNITQARWENRMTIQELARKMGVTHTFVSRMEHGKDKIPDYRFKQISDILGRSVDELFPEVS